MQHVLRNANFDLDGNAAHDLDNDEDEDEDDTRQGLRLSPGAPSVHFHYLSAWNHHHHY